MTSKRPSSADLVEMLVDLVPEDTALCPPPPRTLSGWLALLRDAFLVDVLRRCECRGCWRWGRFPTLLGAGRCARHFDELMGIS